MLSRPLFGLHLSLTVIGLRFGLGLMEYWSRSHTFWSSISISTSIIVIRPLLPTHAVDIVVTARFLLMYSHKQPARSVNQPMNMLVK